MNWLHFFGNSSILNWWKAIHAFSLRTLLERIQPAQAVSRCFSNNCKRASAKLSNSVSLMSSDNSYRKSVSHLPAIWTFTGLPYEGRDGSSHHSTSHSTRKFCNTLTFSAVVESRDRVSHPPKKTCTFPIPPLFYYLCFNVLFKNEKPHNLKLVCHYIVRVQIVKVSWPWNLP